MSDRAASPSNAAASADAPAARPDVAVVGEVSGENVEVKDAAGIPAAESKEETSVIDETKSETEKANTATAEKSADDAQSAPEAKENDTIKAQEPQDDAADATPATPATASKSNARRKSSGVPEHQKKKLNRKQSKVKMSHIDAKPGDYFFIKLKGYPKWPGIIAAEDMLPEAILKSRPVTAARPDGTYREDFADGGKNVLDRTFPVMFLETNEFCWTPNTDLEELDTTTVGDIPKGKMSIALYAAHQLAAENHDLDYFKNLLREFEEARVEEAAAKEAAKAAKTPKKGKKAKETIDEADDEDVEMADAEEAEKKPKATKKRKAGADDDDTATPKRAESVKKPKIKLTTTPKANGTDTPKSAKEKKEKAKPKAKKTNGAAADPAAPAEPELDPETKRKNKEKEVLFLRHKLQKGLLTRDQQPKEDEMKMMSEFITKLEGYADLEVSIIRVTKINKVLKGILKLESIPKEEEFKFKERSAELLGKWNKILEKDTPGATQANGTSAKEEVNGDSKAEAEKKSAEPAAQENTAPEAAPADDADIAMEDAPEKDDAKLEVEEPKEASEDKVETAKTDSAEVEASA